MQLIKIFILLFVFMNVHLFAQKKDRGFLKAQELLEARKYYEALYEFQSVKTHDNFEENFKNEHIALIYSKLNNYKEAIPFLNKITSNNKFLLLGKNYYENKEYDLAIKSLQQALSFNEKKLDVFYYLGKSQYKNKQYAKALINMNKAVELGKEEVLLVKDIGICYYFAKEYLQTISKLEYVKKYFPFDKELNNYLGMSYFQVARKDLAIKTLKEGIDKNTLASAETAVNLSLVYDDIEQNDSAIYYLKMAIEIDPNRVDAYYFLGNKFYDLKKYHQSQYYYEELLRINPNYSKAYKQLANAYFLDNLYDKAIEKYRQSSFFEDKPAEELNYIGICYLQSKNIKMAKSYFEEALKKDASFYIAYLNLANLSFQEKKYDEAISFLSYAEQYEKNNADIYFLYAKIYLQQNNLVDATHYFKETIRFNKLKKQAYLYLGHLNLLENNPQRANFYYDILLTFEPQNFEANLYRGIASFLAEEYDNSVQYLTIAEHLNPKDYKTKYQLSKSLVKSKDYITAYIKLIDLNEQNPSDKRIYYLLFETCKALKIKEEAKKYKASINAFEKLEKANSFR